MMMYCQCGELYPAPTTDQPWTRFAGFCSSKCLREHLRPFIPGELYHNGFPKKFRGATLNDFTPQTQRETRTDAELRRRLGQKLTRGIFLHGALGVGKTFRAVAIAGECSLFGLTIGYSTAEDYIASCQSAFHNEESPVEVRDALLDDDLLVLDDLGAERTTDFGITQIDALIDKAYRRQRPILIITSNSSLNELADDVPRAADRIAEMCDVLKLDGASRRLKREEHTGGYWLYYRRPRYPWENQSCESPIGVTYRRNALRQFTQYKLPHEDDRFDRVWVQLRT